MHFSPSSLSMASSSPIKKLPPPKPKLPRTFLLLLDSMPKRKRVPYLTKDRKRDTRGFSLPSVAVLRKRFGWSLEDETMIREQLGYLPGNAVRVAARVEDSASCNSAIGMSQLLSLLGENTGTSGSTTADSSTSTGGSSSTNSSNAQAPTVLQIYPLNARHASSRRLRRQRRKAPNKLEDDDSSKVVEVTRHKEGSEDCLIEPFPTMLWLTHPKLKNLISNLEKEGFGLEIEKRLYANQEYQDIMTKVHKAHGKERFELLSKEDQLLAQTQPWGPALSEDRGISGVTQYKAVKCLHAHTAHYLSDCAESKNNLVGKWVMEELMARHQSEEGSEGKKGDDSKTDD